VPSFRVKDGKRLHVAMWNQKHITHPAMCSTAYTTENVDKGLFIKTAVKHNSL